MEDCARFYECVSGRATHLTCAAGLAFNAVTSSCDVTKNVPECDYEMGNAPETEAEPEMNSVSDAKDDELVTGSEPQIMEQEPETAPGESVWGLFVDYIVKHPQLKEELEDRLRDPKNRDNPLKHKLETLLNDRLKTRTATGDDQPADLEPADLRTNQNPSPSMIDEEWRSDGSTSGEGHFEPEVELDDSLQERHNSLTADATGDSSIEKHGTRLICVSLSLKK